MCSQAICSDQLVAYHKSLDHKNSKAFMEGLDLVGWFNDARQWGDGGISLFGTD